jgi:hypothetical protein
MSRLVPRMPRHSTIAAYLALFLALGGTSYAVVNLPRNSVGAGELRPNAVRSSDVKNRSLKAIDFQRSSLLKGAPSAPGPVGPAGPSGPAGPAGAPGAPGTARAYARINPNNCANPGPCTLDDSKGVSAAERDSTGVYCATAPGVSSDGVTAAVTVDFSSTSSPVGLAQATLGDGAGTCPSDSFRVVTQRITFNSGTQSLNDAFVNDVGFTIVIP